MAFGVCVCVRVGWGLGWVCVPCAMSMSVYSWRLVCVCVCESVRCPWCVVSMLCVCELTILTAYIKNIPTFTVSLSSQSLSAIQNRRRCTRSDASGCCGRTCFSRWLRLLLSNECSSRSNPNAPRAQIRRPKIRRGLAYCMPIPRPAA